MHSAISRPSTHHARPHTPIPSDRNFLRPFRSHAHDHSERWLTHYCPRRYLHLGFAAPAPLVRPARVAAVWTLLRLRHPLLAAAVEMHAYDDVRYV